MSLTLLGWLLALAAIAIPALLFWRARGSQDARLDIETCKAGLEDIEARLKLGKISQEEAAAARLALVAQLRSPSWALGQKLQGAAGKLLVPATVFLLVASVGAAASYVWAPPAATDSDDASSYAQSDPGPDGELVAQLTDYTRSIASEEASPRGDAGELLPDVSTMIGRLAARLEETPDDLQGWRMLGWSYFHTGAYEQAAASYAKAMALDPSSAELKLAFEEAQAKAAESDELKTASSLPTAAAGDGGDETSSVSKANLSEAMPARERDAAIRSMVDGLAARLERSPRDLEGWTRLMRSRVVLGEREVAATAMRQALEVFNDDAAASGTISAAAIELGLKAE